MCADPEETAGGCYGLVWERWVGLDCGCWGGVGWCGGWVGLTVMESVVDIWRRVGWGWCVKTALLRPTLEGEVGGWCVMFGEGGGGGFAA